MLQLFSPSRRLNVHPSLLPAYRGPAPIQRALMDGQTEVGVSVIEMMEKSKGIDAGEIWAMKQLTIPKLSYCVPLRAELAKLGGIELVSVLRAMMAGTAKSIPQATESHSPRAQLITAADAVIDFDKMSAMEIVARYRAISHQKPIYTYLPSGITLQIHEPEIFYPTDSSLSDLEHPGWTIYSRPMNALIVRCAGDTFLRVPKLKQQDRNLVDARGWWNGVRPEYRARANGNAGPVSLGIQQGSSRTPV